MTVNITPTESDGQFWIRISMDGGELAPRGPYFSNAEAQTAAAQIAATCRALLGSGVHLHTDGAATAARR